MKLTLRCWQCGATKDVDVSAAPEFGFELAQIAYEHGWRGPADLRFMRTLVFCSADCDNKAKTKAGWYRKYPKKS